jgi:mannosyltransferase OCH1-like enzyme
MPEIFKAFGDGWKQLHPGWSLIEWGDKIPLLQNQDIYDRAEEICPALEGQLRSDVVRLELLYKFGGVWIDTDFEALKPIDELLEGVECFAAWVTRDCINNAIMGAVPGHPFIKRLIDGMPASVSSHKGQAPRVVSGPQYLTRVWNEHPDDSVTLFSRDLWYPYLWSELGRVKEKFPKAYGIHHWGNRRRERGREL